MYETGNRSAREGRAHISCGGVLTDKETAARDGAGEHAAGNVMNKREKPVRLFNPSANRRPGPNPYPSSVDRNCTQRRAAEPLGSPAARIVVLVVFLRALAVARLSSLETDSGRHTYSTYAGCAVTARACASVVPSKVFWCTLSGIEHGT